MSKVTILIPSYKDQQILAKSLPALRSALPKKIDCDILLINDAPENKLEDWVKKNVADIGVSVIDMPVNSGFAATLNTGYQQSGGDYVFFYNSDLFIEPGYIEEMVQLLEEHPRAACVTGKILRYDMAKNQKLSIIDSTGFELFKNRRVVDRGEGEEDVRQYDRQEEVFGISGCAWFGRRLALDDVAIDSQVFDENFFMYKEDVELAWRLQARGWEAWYTPDVVAYHGRTSSGIGNKGYLAAAGAFRQNEQAKSHYVRLHSMKNQWLILLLHETWHGWLRDGWRIIGREMMVLGYNSLYAPKTLEAVWLFAKIKLSALKKRKMIQSRRKVSAKEVLKWAK